MQIETQPAAAFKISLDNKDITLSFADRLESLTLTENRGPEADQLDIVLLDHDGKLDIPHRGIKLNLAIGWQVSGLIDKGTFIVDDVEHSGTPDKLTMRARSADLRAGLTTQKERSWHNKSVGDIITSIAKENSLKAVIPSDLATQAIQHIDQTNESDVNLLSRLAKMFDALFTVKSGNLLFLKTGTGRSVSGKPLAPVKITRASGDQHRFGVADRDTYTGVKALYNDMAQAIKGEVLIDEGNVSGADLGAAPATTINAKGRVYSLNKLYKTKASAMRAARNKYRDLSEGKSNYGTVTAYYREVGTGKKTPINITAENVNVTKKDALASNAYEPDASMTASADNIKVLRHIYANKANAIRAAKAEYTRLKRGTSTFGLTLALGRPEISPEQPATVSGWKPVIDSTKWIVTQAVHSLNDSAGLITRLEMELKVEEPNE
ncbi:hypothetical protein C3Y98_05235 [Methylotenera oryzisoli]|uniref:Phage late control D family protein n=1 Tax=Methylotenera oryzisoli TaxID=2080758 RepID=A0A4Y9VRL2_9PROT|nr:contractile injection system protein, VgrG/Pvc8 family [Methylotenera oryzisoli]TFW71502.1 hypothetical protein C3Y98_05235 [Methylotenera oryzisoli]